ncbi:hypothetical protein HYPSUDRAFT_460725 [Hypholoma sublateritium FD-334 SS-4]|uniref:DUF6534 domain-containing protein n=1 Tax=Hypholoma sublateritium (strain FD-334 SS-4) TaxID=945553 RepID=A0A0D2P0L9_HYPSF|nr:hypothetical protein HYPSUDRAFT_460725 [Hypholoma sublateritium FD-334 SS-4]
MSDLPPIPANIAELTVPTLIGTLFNWLLFGALLVQTYVYYLHFGDDKIWQKSLVYGIFTLETAQTAMNGVDLCFWFASGYGNMNHLGNVYISPIDTPILCGIITTMVQCFFAYRIFILRRTYLWICFLIVLTSIMQGAAALGIGILTFNIQEFALFHSSRALTRCVYIWLISDAVCDIIIAGTLLWLLYQSKKEGIELKTLGKLVRLVVETNALTASMAIAMFIAFFGFPNNKYFTCPGLVMGKLYSNTLLVTFNNRIVLRNMNKDHAYASSKSGGVGVSTQGPMVFAVVDIESFRAAPNRSIESISVTESHELKKTTYRSKARSLIPESEVY